MNENGNLPLSHAQKRVFYNEMLTPQTSMHNICGLARCSGMLDRELLRQAINIFIREHDGIRLRLRRGEQEPVQYVQPETDTELAFYDFSGVTAEEREKRIQDIIAAPFSLFDSPLFYFAFFKFDARRSGCFIKFHHIIADGWSIAIVANRISEYYAELAAHRPIPEGEGRGYEVFLEKERKYLASDRFKRNRDFWIKKFTPLPEFHLHSRGKTAEGRRKIFSLDVDISRRMRDFAEKQGSSLHVLVTALFLLYLSRSRDESTIIVGLPVFNRTGAEKRIFGMLTSTMPLRIDFPGIQGAENSGSESFGAYLERVGQQMRQCFLNQKYPYDLLVQDLSLQHKGFSGLFDISVNYYNMVYPETFGGWDAEYIEYYSRDQFYALQMVIKEAAGGEPLELVFDYKTENFTEDDINRFCSGILALFRQVDIPGGETRALAGLGLLDEEEKRRLLFEYNATTCEYEGGGTVLHRFCELAGEYPQKVALEDTSGSMSFGELDRRSNRLAAALQKAGLQRGEFAAIMMHHSFETIIAILGILKCNAAYVPVDPVYPLQRIRDIIDDAGVKLVLTNYDTGMETEGTLINIGDDAFYRDENENFSISYPSSNEYAYMIYTSGSTGKPKGVPITHGNLLNYILWAKEQYVESEEDSFALFSSLAFDLTVTSIFVPLLSGIPMVIFSNRDNYLPLREIVSGNRVSILKMTPSHLSLLRELKLPESCRLKTLIVGGEDLKVKLASEITHKFGNRLAIYNEYGPTEATVGCMIHKYSEEEDRGVSVPIGVPAPNNQIYILDAAGNPLPPGMVGELYIGGEQLFSGYYNNRTLSAKVLVESGFRKKKKIYRSGDLARYIGGTRIIEYCGRKDAQVKIRGYRIELKEIEHHLLRIPAVSQAVVLVRKSSAGSDALYAYLVPAAPLTEEELRAALAATLPAYMIPAGFRFLSSLPVTPNGKIDMAALPEYTPGGEQKEEYIAPTTTEEKILVRCLEKILDYHPLGLEANFFELGGDSIKAIQISNRLEQRGYLLPSREILLNPRVGHMVPFMEKSEKQSGAAAQLPASGEFPLPPIARWFFSRNWGNPGHYCQAVLFRLSGDPDPGTIAQFYNILIRKYDTLRLNYNKEKDLLYYNSVYLSAEQPLACLDIELGEDDSLSGILNARGEAFKSEFDIENGILFKMLLLRFRGCGVKGSERYLLMAAHHLVIDGYSWRLLTEDLYHLFSANANSRPLQLRPVTDSYKSWVEALPSYPPSKLERAGDYWAFLMEPAGRISAYTEFFAPAEGSASPGGEHLTLTRELSALRTKQLLSEANKPYHTRGDELLIISLALALSEISRRSDNRDGSLAVIELENFGRDTGPEDINISRTAGWFTSLYPVLFETGGLGSSAAEKIKALKEQLRQVPDKGFAYGLLRYQHEKLPDLGYKPVRFNYLGDFNIYSGNDYFSVSNYPSGKDSSGDNELSTLLEINAMVLNEKLRILCSYDNREADTEQVESFMGIFLEQIEAVLKHCITREDVDFTPSDFDTAELSADDLDILMGMD